MQPPVPPPPPPPPPQSLFQGNNSPSDRSLLLGEIAKGKKLRKTVTNDRSTAVAGRVIGGGNNSGIGNGKHEDAVPKAKTVVGIGTGTPATVNESLGALFSGGMPCKPSDVKALGIKPLVSASSGSIETTSISSRPSQNSMASNSAASSTANTVLELGSLKKSPPALPPVQKPITDSSSATMATIVQSQLSLPKMPAPSLAELKMRNTHSSSDMVEYQNQRGSRPSLPAKQPNYNPNVVLNVLPTSQQPQFQTLRPTKKASLENRNPSEGRLRRSESTEEVSSIYPEIQSLTTPVSIRRPMCAPPPPPPLSRTSSILSNSSSHSQILAPQFPPQESIDDMRKAQQEMPPPRPPQPPQFRTQQQSIRRSGAPPPPPPPPARSSSYFQSFKARFCFTPIEELPPPPKFEGFHKDYTPLRNHRKTSNSSTISQPFAPSQQIYTYLPPSRCPLQHIQTEF